MIEPTDHKPARKISLKQRLALDVLNNVLADHGKAAPEAEHYPAGAIVVDVDLWRETLFSAGVLNAKAKNIRQPFKRLKDSLAQCGEIREWNGLMWAMRSTPEG